MVPTVFHLGLKSSDRSLIEERPTLPLSHASGEGSDAGSI